MTKQNQKDKNITVSKQQLIAQLQKIALDEINNDAYTATYKTIQQELEKNRKNTKSKWNILHYYKTAVAVAITIGVFSVYNLSKTTNNNKINFHEQWHNNLATTSLHGNYPLLRGNIILTLTKKENDKKIIALDKKTGKEIWVSQFTVSDTLCADNNHVYSWSKTGNTRQIIALDITTGKEKWHYKSTNTMPQIAQSQQILCNNKAIFWINQNKIFAINKTNGTPLWQKDITDSPCKLAKIHNKSQVIITFNNQTIKAYNTITGNLIWQKKNKDNTSLLAKSLAVCNNKTLFFYHEKDFKQAEIIAYNLNNGTYKWQQNIEHAINIQIHHKNLYLKGKKLVAYSTKNGKQHWQIPLDGCSPLSFQNKTIFAVSGKQHPTILKLNSSNGKIINQYTLQHPSCSGVTINSFTGYIHSNNGQLYAFKIPKTNLGQRPR